MIAEKPALAITRKLTTELFANRVDERHRRCNVKGDGG